MKRYEKFNWAVHILLWIIYIVNALLLCIYGFWCDTEQSPRVILDILIYPSLIGVLCFPPVMLLCVSTVVRNIKRKCTPIRTLIPVFLMLISSTLWCINIGLFVTFTGGV